MHLVDDADALLVAGSSLTVFSGYRFVRHAAALGIPVAIINRGRTRGDDLATVKIDNGCSPCSRCWPTSYRHWRIRHEMNGVSEDNDERRRTFTRSSQAIGAAVSVACW